MSHTIVLPQNKRPQSDDEELDEELRDIMQEQQKSMRSIDDKLFYPFDVLDTVDNDPTKVGPPETPENPQMHTAYQGYAKALNQWTGLNNSKSQQRQFRRMLKSRRGPSKKKSKQPYGMRRDIQLNRQRYDADEGKEADMDAQQAAAGRAQVLL